MKLRRLLMASALALSFTVTVPTVAKADPISAAVVAFVGFTGTAAAVATFVINSALYAAGSWAVSKAAQALANSYFEALDMIAKDQAKAYEIMGADVKQTGEQFGNSAKYLRWQDKAANQKFFAGDFLSFNKDAAELLLEVGIIKAAPKVEDIYDASFIK